MKKISVMITSIIVATGIVISSASVLALPNEGIETEVKYKKLNEKIKLQHRKLERQLDLTEQQKVKIKLIKNMAREEKVVYQEGTTAFKEKFNSLLIASVFDQQAFIDLQDQYQSHFSEVNLSKAKYKHAYMQVLDKEQQQKMLILGNKVRLLF
jgi:Spy/CpxP family protein refolding chaperone